METLKTRFALSFKRKLQISISIGLLFAGLLYLSLVMFRATRVYTYIKANKVGFTGRIFANHPLLGFAPVPEGSGAEIFPLPPPIPVRFDANGFRIPSGSRAGMPLRRPLVLGLGCSFTYGTGCLAEEAYPYLVGEILHGDSLNAGVPSYGLVQILILARRWIPKFKPDYVIVAFAPWLVDRALSPFPVLQFGFAPSPFFIEAPDGSLSFHPPVFPSRIFDLPVSEFRTTPRGSRDYIAFLLQAGFPLYFYNDSQRLAYGGKRFLGVIPPPARDREKALKFSYSRIQELCAENKAKMIIVLLRPPGPADLAILRKIPGAVIVNAETALQNRLPEKTELAYRKAYWQWRGSVLIDWHPNARAHRIIAEEIVKAIQTVR